MIFRYRRSFHTVIFILIAISSFGQDKYVHQGSYWFRYYNQSKLTEKLTLHLELDERRLVNPSRQFQFFTHMHLHYQMKPWLDVAGGGSFIKTNSNKNLSLAVPELRVWQEASITKSINSKVQFQFRYRLDERFIHNNDKIVLNDGYHFNLRHRFRFQFQREIKKISDNQSLSFKLSDEVMFSTGDVIHTFDQNRIFTSLEYRFDKKWSIETGYLNLLQSRSDNGFYDRHTIRITAYHKLDFRQALKE